VRRRRPVFISFGQYKGDAPHGEGDADQHHHDQRRLLPAPDAAVIEARKLRSSGLTLLVSCYRA
jgi:hypothetical protein